MSQTFQGSSKQGVTDNSQKLLVAIDFGTTFSCVAWVNTSKPEYIGNIQQWPDRTSGGLEGITHESVPTTLKYVEQRNNHTSKWGYQIGDEDKRYEWFKLELDPHHGRERGRSNLAEEYPSTTALPSGSGVSTETLVIDYLTALRKHVQYVLDKKYTKAVMKIPINYIITVPAVWSPMAQAKTRSCAESAGMGRGDSLHIISEPEAAAVYALDGMTDLNEGDTFVVCDAGGGTVDLISYTVSKLKPTPQLHEAAPGSGDLCGSIFLNRIFAKYMKDRFGNDPDWDEEYIMGEAMKKFNDEIKPNFRGILDEEPFKVPVPGLANNPNAGIFRNRLSLSQATVSDIFEPVIREIIKLVKYQIRTTKVPVKAVLLLGGFGGNVYLRERLRDEVGNVEVTQPINGSLAVVRGALMKGLTEVKPTLASVRVASRSARMYYGTENYAPFNPKLHHDSQKAIDGYNGGHRILTMNWFVQKGESLKESEPAKCHYYWEGKVSEGRPMTILMLVYCCMDPHNKGAPMYRDSGVTELLKLNADLSRIPEHELGKENGADQEMHYTVDFAIEMTSYSAHIKFAILHKGIKYDSVTVDYGATLPILPRLKRKS